MVQWYELVTRDRISWCHFLHTYLSIGRSSGSHRTRCLLFIGWHSVTSVAKGRWLHRSYKTALHQLPVIFFLRHDLRWEPYRIGSVLLTFESNISTFADQLWNFSSSSWLVSARPPPPLCDSLVRPSSSTSNGKCSKRHTRRFTNRRSTRPWGERLVFLPCDTMITLKLVGASHNLDFDWECRKLSDLGLQKSGSRISYQFLFLFTGALFSSPTCTTSTSTTSRRTLATTLTDSAWTSTVTWPTPSSEKCCWDIASMSPARARVPHSCRHQTSKCRRRWTGEPRATWRPSRTKWGNLIWIVKLLIEMVDILNMIYKMKQMHSIVVYECRSLLRHVDMVQ